MAGSKFFLLIDDIAALLDDVAAMSKVAMKKTAGVLGDDLALNAEQVAGVQSNRELPVVWAVFKGSAINKAILVPSALIISLIAPWAITPLLMVGGLFLCFEGCEKILHSISSSKEDKEAHHQEMLAAVANNEVDMVEFEKKKIKGAIRTDFILSAEIIVISLGVVAEAELLQRILVLIAIAVAMTIGVYGLVAGIVKLDDLGLKLKQSQEAWQQKVGGLILAFAPKFMKTLSVAGLIAMFLVGGGIVAHGIGPIHHFIEGIDKMASAWPLGGLWSTLLGSLANGIVGLIAGAIVVAGFEGGKKLWPKKEAQAE